MPDDVPRLQMFVTHNTTSQLTILEQGGAEQLLILLNKATLPRLRISIVCTLWSLTGNEPHRRQSMACTSLASIRHDLAIDSFLRFNRHFHPGGVSQPEDQ